MWCHIAQGTSLDPAQYDPIATAYQEYADTNAYKPLCERPCTLALRLLVNGQSVLNVACGPGFYVAWCAQRGATVCGFDSSPTMVKRARSRLRSMASLMPGSLTAPLSFVPEVSCHVVICALALNYVADLTMPLSEFASTWRTPSFTRSRLERRFG
jgi:ubiquinone/menaquinone biosynthesis C-methylase UbiE